MASGATNGPAGTTSSSNASHSASQSSPPHAMFGADGREWSVVEKMRDGRLMLVATGAGITRSVRDYPAGWRMLSDLELYGLFERPFGKEYTAKGVEDWSSSFEPERIEQPTPPASVAEWHAPERWSQEDADDEAKRKRADVEKYHNARKERGQT